VIAPGEYQEGQVSTITKAFESCDQAALPDSKTSDDRKYFPIFDSAEEAIFKK
jgi:hypothetical protein